jgi:hypothetical protein
MERHFLHFYAGEQQALPDILPSRRLARTWQHAQTTSVCLSAHYVSQRSGTRGCDCRLMSFVCCVHTDVGR